LDELSPSKATEYSIKIKVPHCHLIITSFPWDMDGQKILNRVVINILPNLISS